MRDDESARILIVGFGNPLMADDGVGPEVVRRLASSPLPAGVRVEDGGSDALRLPSIWRGEAAVWIVDAVTGGGEPGEVVRLGHAEVLAVPQRHATAHALSLPEALRWIALTYPEMASVRYRMWGMVAADVTLRAGLSEPAAQAADRVAREILREAASAAVAGGQ
jgi:hydrogenase maturation protease